VNIAGQSGQPACPCFLALRPFVTFFLNLILTLLLSDL